MQERLDNLYDRISGFEEAIEEVDVKITASYGNQINTKELYKILLDYDNIYEKMTDAEKKEFMGTLIELIELYPERTETGRIIKRIILTFPVYYDGHESREMWLPEENTVECATLLERGN